MKLCLKSLCPLHTNTKQFHIRNASLNSMIILLGSSQFHAMPLHLSMRLALWQNEFISFRRHHHCCSGTFHRICLIFSTTDHRYLRNISFVLLRLHAKHILSSQKTIKSVCDSPRRQMEMNKGGKELQHRNISHLSNSIQLINEVIYMKTFALSKTKRITFD